MGVRKFHVLKEVAVFTNICTERLKSLTKKLSDTEDVFAQAEKKCWAKLDSLEERMQSLKMEVKVKVEELVSLICKFGHNRITSFVVDHPRNNSSIMLRCRIPVHSTN